MDHQQTETAGYERSTDDCRRRLARSRISDPATESRRCDIRMGQRPQMPLGRCRVMPAMRPSGEEEPRRIGPPCI